MTASAPQRSARRSPKVGEPIQLAEYTIGEDTRVLIGRRIDGTVRVSDHPADGRPGRRYVIERGLEQDGYGALQALVTDYLAQAAKHGKIPAAHVPIDAYLAALA